MTEPAAPPAPSSQPRPPCVARGLYTMEEHQYWQNKPVRAWPCPACAAIEAGEQRALDEPHGGYLDGSGDGVTMEEAAEGFMDAYKRALQRRGLFVRPSIEPHRGRELAGVLQNRIDEAHVGGHEPTSIAVNLYTLESVIEELCKSAPSHVAASNIPSAAGIYDVLDDARETIENLNDLVEKQGPTYVSESLNRIEAAMEVLRGASLLSAIEPTTYHIYKHLKYTDAIVDAPRQLLAYAETPGRSIQGARKHLERCGIEYKHCWPDWAYESGHLTKSGLAELVHRFMEAARLGVNVDGTTNKV